MQSAGVECADSLFPKKPNWVGSLADAARPRRIQKTHACPPPSHPVRTDPRAITASYVACDAAQRERAAGAGTESGARPTGPSKRGRTEHTTLIPRDSSAACISF